MMEYNIRLGCLQVAARRSPPAPFLPQSLRSGLRVAPFRWPPSCHSGRPMYREYIEFMWKQFESSCIENSRGSSVNPHV